MHHDIEKYKKAADYISSRINGTPRIAVILGSGLGPLADSLEQPATIDYRDIPGFPETTVTGHAERLSAAVLAGRCLP